MLTVYRRHRATCKHTSRRYKGCSCPLWAQGTLRGETIRKSLDLTNWEAAHKLIREWELNDLSSVITLSKAAESFYLDNAARRLSEQQQRKYRNTVEELKEKLGNVTVRSVTVDDLRKIREGWKLSAITQQKRIEMLRSFFRFCVDSLTSRRVFGNKDI